MWGRRRGRRGGRSAEELRLRRREREAALRRARRQEQLVSKRLLREDSAAEEGAQDGADVVPDPLSEDEVLELLRGVQRGSEDRKRSLGRLRWALQNEDTQQKFVRLDGSIRTLTGLFTSSLADLQLEAARCLHELSHSSVPAVAEACLPVTSYLLTYLSGHSLELTELCLYTLGNLVVESEAVRKQLLPQGIIPVLASCIQSPHEAVLEGVGYVLSQLLQAKEAPTEIIPLVLDSALPQHMLQLVCPGLKAGMGAAVEFAWCLHYIICRHEDNALLLALGAVPALTSLLLDLASQIPQDAPEGLELLVCPVLRCLCVIDTVSPSSLQPTDIDKGPGSAKELIKSINEKFAGAAGWEGTEALKKPEDKKQLGDFFGMSNSYAECYPATMDDMAVDSDEEVDYSKMDQGNKKGPLGRWDFDTQEEYSEYMNNKEALPKAAFQYGIKMSEGRKTRRFKETNDKAELDRQWKKISAIIEKRKKLEADGVEVKRPKY
ncbi:transmembrane and coiled-coil domain-containing protein 6-like [Motacilla alba alba]|uniref:transmembrane and coiled-coil domain-containing protein 6-like n=1 Tax=Motacilla alba alba TaxID=1094192 RepID=UPI0018D5802F|nr:transmembrane and coiled-coil domain-containing protein 6-like [Motacilla alba alba]